MAKNELFTEYNDIVAIHPGYYIKNEIEQLGISQDEFAISLGTTGKYVSDLVNGKASISQESAIKLSKRLGTSSDVWLNLQHEYSMQITKIMELKTIEHEKPLLDILTSSQYFQQFKIEVPRKMVDKYNSICKYLQISNLSMLQNSNFCFSPRKANATGLTNYNNIIINAWLRTAQNSTNEFNVHAYSSEALVNLLPAIRELTLEKPDVFQPKLDEYFKNAGIYFIVMPYLKNLCLRGAVFWTDKSSKKPVIAINVRDRYADQFWFSLFHEIKHILQGKAIQSAYYTFIPSKSCELSEDARKFENEADEFASDYLIPKERYRDLLDSDLSRKTIIEFSHDIKIHPGIVVGRLQHNEKLGFHEFNDLREKYSVEV